MSNLSQDFFYLLQFETDFMADSFHIKKNLSQWIAWSCFGVNSIAKASSVFLKTLQIFSSHEPQCCWIISRQRWSLSWLGASEKFFITSLSSCSSWGVTLPLPTVGTQLGRGLGVSSQPSCPERHHCSQLPASEPALSPVRNRMFPAQLHQGQNLRHRSAVEKQVLRCDWASENCI